MQKELRKAQCPVMVKPETLARLKSIGRYGDSMDTIVVRLLDCYEQGAVSA